MTYAATWTRTATGDREFRGGRFVRAPRPLVQVVLNLLHTARGSHPPDPTKGLDYTVTQKLVPGAPAALRAAVLAALAPLVDGGLLRELSVEVDQVRGALAAALSFVDPRTGDRLAARFEP